jgi:fumarate hydratase subunit alpha
MREIAAQTITETVARLCQEANCHLGEDVLKALRKARDNEKSPLGRRALQRILQNAAIATQDEVPLCQDTGIVIVYLDVGQDAHVSGGDINEAVQEGVRRGYRNGYLRKSIVARPFTARLNTDDNTPAVVHIEIVPGENVRIRVMPKGGGSENTSRLTVLHPDDGPQGIIDFVAGVVSEVGVNSCPPLIVGVGIGGTAGRTMVLAKKALLRKVCEPNPDPEVAQLEKDILDRVNELGLGPVGFGGSNTALSVHAEVYPCHISALPVAVNLQCHCARVKEEVV